MQSVRAWSRVTLKGSAQCTAESCVCGPRLKRRSEPYLRGCEADLRFAASWGLKTCKRKAPRADAVAAEGGFFLSYPLPWPNAVSHPSPSLLASYRIHPHQALLTPALPAQAPARLWVCSLQPKPNPDSLSWESGEQPRLAGSSFLEKTFILIVSRDNYWVFSAIGHRHSAGKRAELAAKQLVCVCRGGKGLGSCWEPPESRS